jgi:hypothetical protein
MANDPHAIDRSTSSKNQEVENDDDTTPKNEEDVGNEGRHKNDSPNSPRDNPQSGKYVKGQVNAEK